LGGGHGRAEAARQRLTVMYGNRRMSGFEALSTAACSIERASWSAMNQPGPLAVSGRRSMPQKRSSENFEKCTTCSSVRFPPKMCPGKAYVLIRSHEYLNFGRLGGGGALAAPWSASLSSAFEGGCAGRFERPRGSSGRPAAAAGAAAAEMRSNCSTAHLVGARILKTI
jgi:hypothetical protein